MTFRLHIHDAVLDRFPEYVALVLYVSGLNNCVVHPEALEFLRAAEADERMKILPDELSVHPNIKPWRDVYSLMGSKPSKYLCSAEALLKRVLKGGDTPDINMIVNTYNAISIAHAIPVGGEDWDQLASDLELCFARGDEPFVARQSGELITEYPVKGEVIWRDDQGATCRRWNWRQCERTAVTEHTCNAYFVLDRLPPMTMTDLLKITDRLSICLQKFSPSCRIQQQVLGKSG